MLDIKHELPNRFYEFLKLCGDKNEIYSFCGTIATELHSFIPYDQARVIFLEETGKISSSLLYGVDRKNWNAFMDYYTENAVVSTYSLKKPLHLSENEKVNLCDWTEISTQSHRQEFEKNYVRPLKIKYCLGLGFSDIDNCIRCILSLDRIKDHRYSEDEIAFVRVLHPLLNNLFTKFFTNPPKAFSHRDFMLVEAFLTKREQEIAGLMLGGSSPASIAERLFISKNTTYKHIANMYKKLKVSNRQEFFAKLK